MRSTLGSEHWLSLKDSRPAETASPFSDANDFSLLEITVSSLSELESFPEMEDISGDVRRLVFERRPKSFSAISLDVHGWDWISFSAIFRVSVNKKRHLN